MRALEGSYLLFLTNLIIIIIISSFNDKLIFYKTGNLGKYKNWTVEAAHKMSVVIFQICNIQTTYMKRAELQDYDEEGDPLLNDFRGLKTVIVDNSTDSDMRDFVIPDLKKVINNLQCNLLEPDSD
jgi:hypothetical protein